MRTNWAAASRATILAYHGVGECPHADRPHRCACISPDVFSGQMDLLARHRDVVPLDDLVRDKVRTRRPAVAITFDDGYRNVLDNAAPVLTRHGFVATVFVPTRWIGGTNMWDQDTDCFPLAIMDPAELRDAERQGITIESHGHAHMNMTSADPSLVAEDLRQSVDRLTELLGRSPRYLAYPWGRPSAVSRAAAEEAGFEEAFTCDELDAGPFARERVSIDGRESTFRLWCKTAGAYLPRRRSRVGELAVALIRRVVPRPDYLDATT
jgi:peptidoglycan/xylan/chitin deacetylase (PgdA/CDA1 family)